MDKILTTLRQIWQISNLRQKLIFTISILVLFRLLAHITIPGADIDGIRALMDNQQSQGGFSVLSLLTGGAMENFSIILMGLTPYINSSIIMQLLSVVVPSLENLKKEGEAGQRKISQYTRLLTVPLAFVQSYGMMLLINRLSPTGNLIDTSDWTTILPMMLIVTGGTMLLVWLGELISEKGIGNGISLLIFAGIVSTIPTQIAGSIASATPPVLLALFVGTIALTVFIVYISEADRRIPVIYASRASQTGQKSFLPLKINQAGMIPIIFAISVVSFPSIIAEFLTQSASANSQAIGAFIKEHLNPGSPTLSYNSLYALLIIGFTYFYVSIVFDPKKISENIQKRSGYVPGYRPGSETEKLLDQVTSRLCFWGGVFLAFVAVFPLFFERWIGDGTQSVSLFISGAGLIIVVSVVLDLIRRINSQLVMHDYEKL